MAASTARRDFHIRITRPPSLAGLLLILLALGLPATSAIAQISCPMGILGGNGQSALAGTRFSIPLTVGQTGATGAIPASFDVSWNVTAGVPPIGNVYIEESGTTSFTETGVTWSGPPFQFSASINIIAEPNANGVYTIQGSTPPCTSAFSTFNVNVFAPVVPSLNPFQGGNQTGVTGTQFPTDLGVVVSQGAGTPAPVPDAKVVYTIISGPAQFSNGTNTISAFTDGTGHAFVPLFANPGVNVLTPVNIQVSSLGTMSGYSGVAVAPAGGVENIAATPSTTGLYSTGQNSMFVDLFNISLTDGLGLPLPSVPVTFTISGATGATIVDLGVDRGTSFSIMTDSGGAVGVNVRAGNSGNFTLTATTPSNSASWNLQTLPAGAQTLGIISGDGQITEPETQFPAPLVLEALMSGTPVSGLPVQLTIRSGSAYFLDNSFRGAQSPSGSLTPVQTISVFIDNTFRASTNIYAGPDAGDVLVEATAGGYSSIFYNLQVRGLDPDQVIKLSGDNQQGSLNMALARPLVAGVTPIGFVNGNGAPLVFEILSGSASFGPQGTPTYSAVPSGSELSAPATLILGNTPGDVQVRVSYPGMLPAVFNASAISGGSGGRQLLRTSGDGQIATTELISDPLRVRLSDGASGVADADIEWVVLSGNASLINPHTRTDANGDSETTLQIGAASGAIVVRAMTPGADGTSVLSTDFNLSAADAQLRSVAGSGQSGSIGSDADEVFVFELRRANGALLPGQTISFTANLGATLTPTSAITGADGRVSVGARYGNESGGVEVTAKAFGGRVSAIGQASTFVPTLSIASGNNQSAGAGADLANPLVVVIARPAGLREKGLQGARVNWTVVSGGGSLGSAVTMTDANGRSSNNLRLGQALGTQQVRAAIEGVGEVVFNANSTIPANSVLEIISGNGQQIIPRRPSAPLVVRLRTADGSNLSGFTVRFTPSTNATVDPTDVVTGADGRASTIANVTLPGDYTVTASLPALTSVTPVVFNLGNGLANIPQLRPGQNKVARAIDRACPRLASMSGLSAAQQDLLSRCSELVVNANSNTSDVVNALDKMLADESSAQNNAALASATAQFENLKGRLAALRSGSQGVNFGGLAIVTPSGRLPFSFLPANLVLKAADDDPSEQQDSGLSRWGFFATGTIGNGSRDPGDVDPGGDFDNYGLTAGVDYRVSDSLVLGAALGFNSNDSQLNQNLGDLESRGYSLSAYGTMFRGNNYYADAVLTLGRNSTDVTRRINYTLPSLTGGTTVIDQVASGSPDSDQQSFALSVGKDFNRGAWSFGPYLRGTYTRLDFDGYVERMSNPTGPGAGLALEVDGRSLSSIQGVLGGKLSYVMSTSWGVLMPNVQIEYVKEFEDDADGLVTRFAFDPTNTSIVIDGDEVDSDFLNIGIGLSAVFANGRSGYLYYEHVAGKERISQGSLALGVRIEF